VLRDGLPEVIREAAISPGMSEVEWAQAVTTQVSRAVAFHDSMYPDSKLEEDAPLFVTGSVELAPGGIDAALSRLPYERTSMPLTLRAPADFPFDRYAANVGLALLAGKRWWQRTRVPLINRARFDFLPDEFKPRTLPLRAIATAALAVVFVAGLFAGYEQVTAKAISADAAASRRDAIERQVQIRNARVREVTMLRQQIEDIESQTLGLIASAELIRVRDRGIAEALAVLAENVPVGMVIEEMNDDGDFISVLATSDQYAPLLQYAQNLELLDKFERVRVRSIGTVGAGDTGSTMIEIEITRRAQAQAEPPGQQAASAR
jgi:Tfp pilus assembly protein PilN